MELTKEEVVTLITALRLIERRDSLTDDERALLERAYTESEK